MNTKVANWRGWGLKSFVLQRVDGVAEMSRGAGLLPEKAELKVQSRNAPKSAHFSWIFSR